MDAIRLYAEFQDDLGTEYRLNIHQAGWQVSPVEFYLGADGFTLSYSGDNENRMQPIIGSELTFTLTEDNAQHSLFITALATSQDAEFTVSIWKGWQVTDELFWTGVLLAEQIELMDEAYPIQNTLNAVDELGNLTNTEYTNNGTAYTGRDNIAQHIYKCLSKTRALHVYADTDVLFKYANDFQPATFQATNALIEAEVNHSAFYNQDADGLPQFFDTFKVLQDLAITFNARVFFSGGVFYFLPVGLITDGSSIDVHTVTKGGTVSASTSSIDLDIEEGTNFVRMRGGSTTFLPPLQSVRRTWVTNANFPVLFDFQQFLNPNSFQTAIGTTISDNDLLYESGTELRISFKYTHEYDGGGSFTGEDIPSRLLLRLVVKCGALYYNNTITVGPNTITYGNFEGNSTVEQINISAPSWSASAGYFYIPLTQNYQYIDRNTGQVFFNQAWPSGVLNVQSYNAPLVIDLDPLTSEQSGLDVTATIQAVDHAGVSTPDVIDGTAFGKLSEFAIFSMNGQATNGDEVVYDANTGENGQVKLEQPSVEIGSSSFDNYKAIYDNNSTPGELINEWNSQLSPQEEAAIHTLGVLEVIRGQNNSTPVRRGTAYKSFFSPYHVVNFTSDSSRYLPFQTTFIARPVECEYEVFQLDDNDSAVVTPQPEVIDTHEPQDDGEPVYDIRNTFEPDAGNVPPNVLRRFLQQPVRSITNRATLSESVTATDSIIFNTYTGGNGTAIVYLPTVTGNEGRVLRFIADSTIAANKVVAITPNASDSGVTIDGASTYNLNRDYDGVSILCHASNWYIIQKKEK
jgi:hypothetical protein